MKHLLKAGFVLLSITASAQTQLAIPDTLVGPNYTLTMHKDSVQFFPTGNVSRTYAFNQYKYLNLFLYYLSILDIHLSGWENAHILFITYAIIIYCKILSGDYYSWR